tara:strand:- start:192 stop:869 length:678 start_codon:yes stop_codon:yes gene_type:complete
MSILEIVKVNKSFNDGNNIHNVINDISLTVSKNEIIIIMGPSGSGKTTLLNLISMIAEMDSGSMIFDEIPLNISDPSSIDKIRSKFLGLLFQSDNLLPEFTVLENLMLPYKINNIKEHHDPIKLIKTFSLEDKLNSFPKELSAGEAQRISLIRAIINKPSLILADEPTANLDEQNIDTMIEFIKDIREKFSTSFIIATHDERLCDIADKILYLDNGKLSERKRAK